MPIRHTAVVLSAALAAFGAQAASYDFGDHDPVAEASFAVGGGLVLGAGAFMDTYTFTLPSMLTVTSTVSSVNQAPVMIADGSYHVLSAGVDGLFSTADDVAMPSFAFDGTTGSLPHSMVLDSGLYAYVVSGTVTGLAGYYGLVSTVSAVPEPETFGLMLAGLGVMGFLARRRSTR